MILQLSLTEFQEVLATEPRSRCLVQVWKVISPWLDKGTLEKTQLLGGPKEYLPKLRELIADKDIPEFLGGADKTCDFRREQGPWVPYLPTPEGPLH